MTTRTLALDRRCSCSGCAGSASAQPEPRPRRRPGQAPRARTAAPLRGDAARQRTAGSPDAPTPPPPPPPAPPAPRRDGQPINIKVDVTITDQSRERARR